MNLNSIRRLLFTNRLSESLFFLFLKKGLLTPLVNKLVAGNNLYDKDSLRDVERNGITYRLDISDYQAWLIYYMSEKDSSQELMKYLGDSKVIIDIGGNIGQTSLEINRDRRLRYDDYKIISFEPYPETYSKFINNLKLNAGVQNIIVENVGLGEAESEISMFQDCSTNSGGNRVAYDLSKNTVGLRTVKITTLDKYLKFNGIEKVDFIKVDVEGYEFAALKGAIHTLKMHKPKLYIELDDHNLKKQGSSSFELISFLKSLNYNIKDVHNKYPEEELLIVDVHTDIYCE